MFELTVFAVALVILAALCTVPVFVGHATAACLPVRAAARAGTLVVTTGFAAIGLGVIALVAAPMPSITLDRLPALYAAFGLVSITLGAGFTTAARMLRSIIASAVPAQAGNR